MRSLSSSLLCIAFAATIPAFAQLTTAELSGNNTDPAGGAVGKVKITAVNTETGACHLLACGGQNLSHPKSGGDLRWRFAALGEPPAEVVHADVACNVRRVLDGGPADLDGDGREPLANLSHRCG